MKWWRKCLNILSEMNCFIKTIHICFLGSVGKGGYGRKKLRVIYVIKHFFTVKKFKQECLYVAAIILRVRQWSLSPRYIGLGYYFFGSDKRPSLLWRSLNDKECFIVLAAQAYHIKHHIFLMYRLHNKKVCLSWSVKVTDNDKTSKNTSLLWDMSIFRTLRVENVLQYRPQ